MIRKDQHPIDVFNIEFKNLLHLASTNVEVELKKRINVLNETLKNVAVYRINYHDLLFYERGIQTMPAYYGTEWTKESFYPSIQRLNPSTMLILEFITLTYAQSVYNMLVSDIHTTYQNKNNETLFFDKKALSYFLKESNTTDDNIGNPLLYYVMLLKELFAEKPNTREVPIPGASANDTDTCYISSEMYRNITNELLKTIQDEKFNELINRLIGDYKLYFTPITYFNEVQPLFLNVIYDTLLHFDEVIAFNRRFMKTNATPAE